MAIECDGSLPEHWRPGRRAACLASRAHRPTTHSPAANAGLEAVQHCWAGYNVTIFAYGQTGSGIVGCAAL